MTGRIKYQCLQIAWYAALRRSPPSLHTHNMTAHAWFIALHPNRMNKAAHLTNRTQLNGSTGNGTAGRCAHAHTHTQFHNVINLFDFIGFRIRMHYIGRCRRRRHRSTAYLSPDSNALNLF